MDKEFKLYKNLINELDISENHISCIAIKYPKKCFKYLALGALATSLFERIYLLTFTEKGLYLIKLGNGITVMRISEKVASRKSSKIKAEEISCLVVEEEYFANAISGYWLKIEGKKSHNFFIPNSNFTFENSILNNSRNVDLLIQNNFFELGNRK
ncbi:hypothetical protein P7H50_01530 [Enterococcus durans]|uniref:hypothetical protein n=1 Tax=Enterococcus TaxID=1350 RepID=UPI0028913309|nr:hypothetical protein [Enterococcus durans]MDT2835592.1 hypothetical protein [Enterococcus durans]